MTNYLKQIESFGQAVWLDNLHRGLIEDGALKQLIEQDGLTGVTSNPSIFEKGMGHSDRYDDDYREAIERTDDPEDVFFQLGYKDVRGAADLLKGIFDATDGQDGYVSFELQPALSFDTDGSVQWARRHYEAIGRENVLIKVPGTPEGVRAFEELTARGINVNVTLLFSVCRYREVADAYISGLERRAEAGEAINRAASVASFFVSRVDTEVDRALDEIGGHDELKGRAAVANAKLAYEAFEEMFSGERWGELAGRGANVQRPLWASTSVKNPDYRDTLYVDELIGPHTVNTMPDATLETAREHAAAALTVNQGYADAHATITALKHAGIDFDDIVERRLVEDGVKAFAQAYGDLIETIRNRSKQFTATR